MASFVRVESVDDDRLQQFRLNERSLADRRHKRDDAGAGLFLAEGDLVVERALDAGCRPHLGLADAARIPAVAERLIAAGCDVFLGGDQLRQAITRLGMPQPIVALFHRPPRPSAAELVATSRRLVIAEAVDNPANVGAIIRNAAGFGWDGLLLDHTSADPLSRRALRVSMGTIFMLPHARSPRLADLLAGADDLELFALTPERTARSIGEIRAGARRAIVIGSERAGISDAVRQLATPVRIPMSPGVDSLNAGAAAAVACYVLG